MSSPYSGQQSDFDWNKYLAVKNSEEVPEDFFHHVCKSELNGIELGTVVEVENEDKCGYWFASVTSSKGVLINLHYFGDENDKHDFWLEVESPRIHPLNWGSENNKKLIPPSTTRFKNVNLKTIKEKVLDCEHIVSNVVLKMKGAPIYNIFKPGMFVEVQDDEYPYRVWVTEIIKNVGGRLLLKRTSNTKNLFWLFYLNERIFPLGWAEQKGLPWRVMNVEDTTHYGTDSSSLINVIKPKTPGQHSFKVGEMLEVINPFSLMVFYVATIVKIYDNRYFKVELDNDINIEKRITLVATKDNPYLFNAGWSSRHNFVLKPPSDWKTSDKFCWSEYITMKNSKPALIDNTCRKQIGDLRIGMKLEAVDPVNPDRIRVVTVKGFTDHWMFLAPDRSSWKQELLQVRSIYSDEIFPVGWCFKHKYPLNVPKSVYTNIERYEKCYYASDDDIDLDETTNQERFEEYPEYLKGDILYHCKYIKDSERIEIKSIEPTKNKSNEKSIESSRAITERNGKYVFQEPVVKTELPELDEEFHDALFSEEKEVDTTNEDVENEIAFYNLENRAEERIDYKKENLSAMPLKMFHQNKYTMSIYFNKNCYVGGRIMRKNILNLPNMIGPGPVSKILQQAISLFVSLDYCPWNALKKIKELQHMLFNEPGGVEVTITANQRRSNYSETLILPESKMMAQSYCSALCNVSGMCENFMTSESALCSRDCNASIRTLPFKTDAELTVTKATKRKIDSIDCVNAEYRRVPKSVYGKIRRIAAEKLDWSNKPLVKRFKNYVTSLLHLEVQYNRLSRSFIQNEKALVTEIIYKKSYLRSMDKNDLFSNTKCELNAASDGFHITYIKNWKCSYENHYRQDSRFETHSIDIGDFQTIKVLSNPKYWNPEDVYNYLSSDLICIDTAKTLMAMRFDGSAFMLLTEELLLSELKCSINLMIRVLCHVAEVKYICLTQYKNA